MPCRSLVGVPADVLMPCGSLVGVPADVLMPCGSLVGVPADAEMCAGNWQSRQRWEALNKVDRTWISDTQPST